MSSTREYRNLGLIEEAIEAVEASLTVAENTARRLAHMLPDDCPPVEFGDIRKAIGELQARLNV